MANPAGSRISNELFSIPETSVYAVLDGASIEDLLDSLDEHGPEHVCLYRGDLPPDLAETAPYLVRLQQDSPFANWLLSQGWGKHWGIFAVSGADMKAVRKHFRTFLIVKAPDGKRLYFRYYDPRVLRVYLPTCNAAETRYVFGPVVFYALEGDDPATLLRFWPEAEGPRKEEIALPSGEDIYATPVE